MMRTLFWSIMALWVTGVAASTLECSKANLARAYYRGHCCGLAASTPLPHNASALNGIPTGSTTCRDLYSHLVASSCCHP